MGKSTVSLSSTQSLAEAARQIFTELHQEVISHEDGVLKGEVEAVHDMRVSCRRLRVALSNFAVCCQPATAARMRAILGELAQALGAVRDLGVMLDVLEKYKASLSVREQRSAEAIIRRLRARQMRRRWQLKAFLHKADYASFKQDFLSVLQPPPAATMAQEADGQST